MRLLSKSSKHFKNIAFLVLALLPATLLPVQCCSSAVRIITLITPDLGLQSLATEFNQAHKDIQLIVKQATYNAGQPVVTSEVDLIAAGFNNFNDSMFLELQPLLRNSSQVKQALRWALPHILRTSGLRIVPISHNPYFVFARKQHLLDMGIDVSNTRWTWSEFATITTKLMAPPSVPWGTVLDAKGWAIPFVQGGGNYIKGPYDKARDGLEMVYQIQAIYSSHAPISDTRGCGSSTVYFINGTAATTISAAHTLMRFAKSNFLSKDLGWITLPLPGDSPTAPGVTYFGQFLGIAANTTQWADAWKVIEWFLSPAGAQALLRTGHIPLVQDPTSSQFLSTIYGGNAENLFNREFNIIANPFADIVSTTKVFNEVLPSYFRGEKSVEETIAELNYRTQTFR